MVDHPAFNASEEAWIAWVNEVAPFRGARTGMDPQIATLCRYPDREFAAVAARQLLLARANRRIRQPMAQRSLFGDGK
jgi:hypothetical protein